MKREDVVSPAVTGSTCPPADATNVEADETRLAVTQYAPSSRCESHVARPPRREFTLSRESSFASTSPRVACASIVPDTRASFSLSAIAMRVARGAAVGIRRAVWLGRVGDRCAARIANVGVFRNSPPAARTRSGTRRRPRGSASTPLRTAAPRRSTGRFNRELPAGRAPIRRSDHEGRLHPHAGPETCAGRGRVRAASPVQYVESLDALLDKAATID